ncbi:MAG: PQQ-binding-like beta-propeller repeat protein, partial [Actinobacteria bacterium]|nr:PQQ-binding-like beta-propeller repeat protein [Actinomycetota bacterium]
MQNNSFDTLPKNSKDKNILIILFFCIILVVGVSNALYAVDTLWHLKTIAGHVDTSPGVADLDGDGVLDLVLCSTKGRVLAVDANGHEKWTFDAKETISNPPTVAGRPLRIYVMTNPGRIICLSAENGAKIWEYKMPSDFSWGMTALAAADMTGDGQIKLIAADRGGHLVCLDTNGAPLWKTTHKSGFNTAPAVSDLDGDGRLEILLGTTDMPLVCFSNKGKELWHVKGGDPVASSPLVCDLNNDGTLEILLGEGDGFSVYDTGGVRKWHHPMKSQVHDAVAVGDVDQDGREDIVVVDLLGDVACLTGGGKLKWTVGVGQRARRSPAIADIDGDMKPEVIVGNYSDALHIFDGQGNLKEQVPLNGGMNASPTVVDFR